MKVMKKTAAAKKQRRKLTPAFKATVALAALREDMTMVELCKKHNVHVTQINEWKKQLLARATEVFSSGDRPDPVDLAPLHAKIGQLTLENDFLEGALTKAGLLSAKQ